MPQPLLIRPGVIPDAGVGQQARGADPRGYSCKTAWSVVIGNPAADPAALAECWLHSGDSALLPALEHGPLLAALGDRRSGRVVVARDAMGLGRVYASAQPDGLWAAASFRALAAAMRDAGRPLTLDRSGLGLYLTFQYLPFPYTLFREISQVPPGTIAEADAGALRHLPAAAPLPGTAEDAPPAEGRDVVVAGRAVVELIAGSLRRQLGQDPGPAMFLSGGMDSSTAGALSVTKLGVRPVAYTATFAEDSFDESAYAAIIADHFGLVHRRIGVTPAAFDLLPQIVRGFDLPHADRSVLAEHLIARAAADAGHRTLVSGEGGDEILGFPRTRGSESLAGLPSGPQQLATWYLDRTALTGPRIRDRLFARLGVDPRLAIDHLAAVHRPYSGHAPFDRLLFGQWQTWLVDGVLAKDTQVLQAQGLRPVFPYIDRGLARYVASLDPAVRRAGLHEKRFLKQALASVLPAATIQKPKQKFLLPFADWFREALAVPIRERLLDQSTIVTRELGADLVGGLLHDHEAGRAQHDRLLWALLFLNAWWSSLGDTSATA
jgi:asparagine synthase (glutamine-hydrolysing)